MSETRDALLALDGMRFTPETAGPVREIIREIFDYEEKIDGEWGCCHGADVIADNIRQASGSHGQDDISALVALAKLAKELSRA